MRVFINYKVVNEPCGGGNQFLKALSVRLRQRGLLVDDWRDADVILFNNYHAPELLFHPEISSGKKVIIHRVAGLTRLQSHPWDRRDMVTKVISTYFSDGTIFQSGWAKQTWLADGLKKDLPSATIINAPDPALFHREARRIGAKNSRLKLIAVSWSSNPRKGFDVYSWLDQNLDFDRYEMTFVGNAPHRFKNIRVIPPVDSPRLADIYREHDVYITAVQHEPCSNALLEAMHCGLPAVAFDQGGNPEIVGRGGRLFRSSVDIPEMLEDIRENYTYYQIAISVPGLDEIVDRYVHFFAEVKDAEPKRIKSFDAGIKALKQRVFIYKIVDRLLYWRGKALSLVQPVQSIRM